jgi:hypothetical protein
MVSLGLRTHCHAQAKCEPDGSQKSDPGEPCGEPKGTQGMPLMFFDLASVFQDYCQSTGQDGLIRLSTRTKGPGRHFGFPLRPYLQACCQAR